MSRAVVAIKGVIAVALCGWAVVWMRAESVPTHDDLEAELTRIESRLDGKVVADLERRVAALRRRINLLSRHLDSAEGGGEPNGVKAPAPIQARRQPAKSALQSGALASKSYNEAGRVRARQSVALIEKGVDGLSKDQIQGLEEIFRDCHEQETKELRGLQGQPNIGARFGPIREAIMMDRYTRIRELLSPAQMNQLVERVPLPIVPAGAREGGK